MQDLWADYAGEALTTEDVGHGGRLRRRRLSEQAALMMLRAWLLRDYMLPYGTSLGATRIFQRCYWLDGLGNPRVNAGAGLPTALVPLLDSPNKRRGAKASTPPTPLPLALQFAEETALHLAKLERPISLHAFALDERRGRRKAPESLQSGQNGNTPGLVLPKEGGLLSANWPELAPALLASLGQSAAVFLLNPLKEHLFRYSDLAPLYQRTAPTELFLLLPHKQIEANLLPGLRTSTGAAALTNLLRNDRWKALLARTKEQPEETIAGLVELFAESLRPHFLSVQSLTFPIHGGPALVEPAPYALLFATRRQDSLFSLNNAVCKRARQVLAESHRGVLNEAWFNAQREEQIAAQRTALLRETLDIGRANRTRRWPDLRLQLLLKHFGQCILEEYDQVILDLLARGEVRCEWRKRGIEPDEHAIPGNEDLLLWK